MIITEGLSKLFDDFLAVDGVSLRVEPGEVLALLGPNGAGKTTTVRMLTSVLRPSRGRASVSGFDVVEQAEQVRKTVGVLTEQHGLYGRMRANEYLDFFGQIYGMSHQQRKRRAQELLEQFGLAQDQKRRIGEYSKGMRQKLALARALIHDPGVLLLDEPSSAMDPESARLVRDAIQGLRTARRAIIICTHNLAEAEELASQIAIIRRGRIIVRGTVDGLKDQLLGLPEYEVTLGSDGAEARLPSNIIATGRGPGWIRYQTSSPQETNPAVIACLVDQGLPVISLAQVPRSLERVYLQAVTAPEQTEAPLAE